MTVEGKRPPPNGKPGSNTFKSLPPRTAEQRAGKGRPGDLAVDQIARRSFSTNRDGLSLWLPTGVVSSSFEVGRDFHRLGLVFKIAGHLVQQREGSRAVDRAGERAIAASFVFEGAGGKRHGPVTARFRSGSSAAANIWEWWLGPRAAAGKQTKRPCPRGCSNPSYEQGEVRC